MVAAGHELGAVGERDTIGALDRRPVRQDRRPGEASVLPALHRAEYLLPDAEIGQRSMTTVGHEDPRLARGAVHASVAAAAVGIDRPLELNAGGGGDAVDRRLGADLVEPGVEGLRGVLASYYGVLREAREAGIVIG